MLNIRIDKARRKEKARGWGDGEANSAEVCDVEGSWIKEELP